VVKEWTQMSAKEKLDERFRRFISTENREFISLEAKQKYHDKATRIVNALKLQPVDKTPVIAPDISFTLAGRNLRDAMYDFKEAIPIYQNFLKNVDEDIFNLAYIPSGKVYDLIDLRQYKWPGHGLPVDYPDYQYVDKEWVKADEYDELVHNTNQFVWTKYIPRLMGTFEPVVPLFDLSAAMGGGGGDFALMTVLQKLTPEFFASIQKFAEAGKELQQWGMTTMQINAEAEKLGFPLMMLGVVPLGAAPFDDIGNMIRGTRGVLMDMYRNPEKLLETEEFFLHRTLAAIKRFEGPSGFPIASLAIHKGGDEFMSDKQFATFYWPAFKKVLEGIIDLGYMPLVGAEGYCDTRLEYFNEMPKGSVFWHLENTDMFRAKKILGDRFCIGGGLKYSQFVTDRPDEIKKRCKELIEVCGKGNGYIISSGGLFGVAPGGKLENVHAVLEAAKEYSR
jgi:uroporphyrinogen-III decarboxylase